jgi:hypothetical protein
MKPASDKPQREERERATDTEGEAAATSRNTPSTDMQPEDAGTAASGASRRGTAAESAMKQTGKTGNETGTGR